MGKGRYKLRIIILAAGKGERLMPLTKNTPKPLLDMGNGTTLLEEQISRIRESGVIDEIILVVGYLAEQVEAKIRYHVQDGMKIRTLFNPLFEITNNLVSLWVAKSELHGEFMITNGDNLFDTDVFSGLTGNKDDGIYLSVSRKDTYDSDDMKVSFENGTVSRVSKEIPTELIEAESPGLAMIRGERMGAIFRKHLDISLRNSNNLQTYWLQAFNCLHEHGIQVKPWFFNAAEKWREVDFHMDVKNVRELLQLKMK